MKNFIKGFDEIWFYPGLWEAMGNATAIFALSILILGVIGIIIYAIAAFLVLANRHG